MPGETISPGIHSVYRLLMGGLLGGAAGKPDIDLPATRCCRPWRRHWSWCRIPSAACRSCRRLNFSSAKSGYRRCRHCPARLHRPRRRWLGQKRPSLRLTPEPLRALSLLEFSSFGTRYVRMLYRWDNTRCDGMFLLAGKFLAASIPACSDGATKTAGRHAIPAPRSATPVGSCRT